MRKKLDFINLSQLTDLVDQDKSNHILKTIAELFLLAANDWPTQNLDDISQFVNELKNYFGTPLTKEKISGKVFSIEDGNAWRHEAGSSLVELLELAEANYKQISLDETIIEILNYYRKI